MSLPTKSPTPANPAAAGPAASSPIRLRPRRVISRQAWMLTFTDLVSLLLTFFVLMFSMSTLEIEKWQAIAASLSRSLDVAVRGGAPAEGGRLAVGRKTARRALDLDYLASVLRQSLSGTPLAERIVIRRGGERLVVSLPADHAFPLGSAALSPRARQTLVALASVLRTITNQVASEGHADPTPVHGGTYASNWELSLARAESVAAVLRAMDGRRTIVARGFADSRYAELPPGDAAAPPVLARRVDIVILQPSGEP